jgi:hypothetical protein
MKKFALWLLAFLITLSAALYQRLTGPTYPIRGKSVINGTVIKYRLIRTHEIGPGCEISLKVPDTAIDGYLLYKRYPTDDPWEKISLSRKEDRLSANLPQQPSSGKLAYRVYLAHSDSEVSLTGNEPVIIRFKDYVPRTILFPHIIVMFLAMLFSTRAGLEALQKNSNPRKLVIWTVALLFVGGLILGPLVQKYAFGALWTGFPFGYDLTDNKTLIAFLGWIAALIAGRRGKPARGWVLGASALLLIVYLIPHSVLGSQLDYSKLSMLQQ